MKKYPPTVFSEDVWKEIERFLHVHPISCLPSGSVADGMEPIEIETTKKGVEVQMEVWFLTGAKPQQNPQLEVNLCLSRPRFSTTQNVTVEKIRTAFLSESSLDGETLHVTLT